MCVLNNWFFLFCETPNKLPAWQKRILSKFYVITWRISTTTSVELFYLQLAVRRVYCIKMKNTAGDNGYLWIAKKLYFTIFRQVRKITKSDYSLRHVRLSVRMEQLSTNWTN